MVAKHWCNTSLNEQLKNLTFCVFITSSKVVIVGNETSLLIENHGNDVVYVDGESLSLNIVFYTLIILNNLILVQRLCAVNRLTIEFNANFFCVKEELTHRMIHKGNERDGLYCLASKTSLSFQSC